MTLPVPGGILAQLAPASGGMDPRMLMAMAAMGKGAPDATPGAAIAPAAVQAPTVAANAAPPPIAGLDSAAPVAALPGPGLADAAAGLPQGAIQPQRRGVLGSIGDTLHDPNFKAEALRFAAGVMAPGHGGLGNGILAATQFADQRRAQAEDARRFDAELGLKTRGMANDEHQTDLTGQHYERSDSNQRYGINADASTARRGQDVSERGNIRDNGTRVATNHEDNQTSRANVRDSVNASIYNNNNDNATARDVATGRNETDVQVAGITSGAKGQMKADDAQAQVQGMLPAMVKGFPGDKDGGLAAWDAMGGDTQARLVDAFRTGYGNGDGNAMERAQKAVAGVLGDGASYTDDNSWIPGVGSPEFTPGAAKDPNHYAHLAGGGGNQGTGEKQVVRTGTDKATGKKVVQYSDGSISYAD